MQFTPAKSSVIIDLGSSKKKPSKNQADRFLILGHLFEKTQPKKVVSILRGLTISEFF